MKSINLYAATLKERGEHFDEHINAISLTDLFNSLKMEGQIESGYRYWTMDHISTMFMYLKDIVGISSYFIDLTGYSEKPLSCIEKTREERDNQISVLASRLLILHRKNLVGML